jgi:hypothetical protein
VGKEGKSSFLKERSKELLFYGFDGTVLLPSLGSYE